MHLRLNDLVIFRNFNTRYYALANHPLNDRTSILSGVMNPPVSWDELLRSIVNLIIGLSWPIVVLLLVGWRFKAPISAFIDRIREVRKDGVSLDQNQIKTTTLADKPLEKQLQPEQKLDPAIVSYYESFKSQASRLPENDRENILIKACARSYVDTLHALTESVIFGSQIQALKWLREGQSNNEVALRAMFDRAKKEFPGFHENRSFEDWLSFLRTKNFVVGLASEMAITDFGRDYLAFRIRAGLTEFRIG